MENYTTEEQFKKEEIYLNLSKCTEEEQIKVISLLAVKTKIKIMDTRYRNYRRRKFQEWREKIKQMLPELVIKFYQHDKYIPYEQHVQLGRVITAINNPFYTIQDDKFNNLDEMGELSNEVLLKIITEDLIKFVNNLHTSPELLNPSNK